MPKSTELNAGDCLVGTRLSYPKQLYAFIASLQIVTRSLAKGKRDIISEHVNRALRSQENVSGYFQA